MNGDTQQARGIVHSPFAGPGHTGGFGEIPMPVIGDMSSGGGIPPVGIECGVVDSPGVGGIPPGGFACGVVNSPGALGDTSTGPGAVGDSHTTPFIGDSDTTPFGQMGDPFGDSSTPPFVGPSDLPGGVVARGVIGTGP